MSAFKPAILLVTTIITPATAKTPCDELIHLTIPKATITQAKILTTGEPHTVGTVNNLPPFCRVTLTSRPTADSEINIEIRMPVNGWNHDFEANGNGGWTGSINARSLERSLFDGFATAMTDTGHQGGSARFALGHPEKIIDFGYRAVHEMTVAAKLVIEAFYGEKPEHSFWNGCSAGGKQGLKEAQRYPADYDGILAGSPAANWIGRATQAIWTAQAVHTDEASDIPPAKYPLIHRAVLDACDALDGVKDGLLTDPTRCKFNPAVLQCKDADESTCLTASQVEAARKIYSPSINPRTNKPIFSGLAPGSELGWGTWAGPQPLSIAYDHFRYVVFKDPNWDFRSLNFDSDIALAEQIDNGTINALDPDLKAFFARGGKLLQYHGWSDPQISPGNSVEYYNSVVEAMGGRAKIDGSYRLFMVPGMAHCGGGEGPNQFGARDALQRWVKDGRAPDRIITSGSHNAVITERPLCPYPQVAKYTGKGSTDNAANFVCRNP